MVPLLEWRFARLLFFVCCLVASALSCTTAAAPKRLPALAPTAVAPSAATVIDRATELFFDGKQAALSGDFSCAEIAFQAALDAVAPEGDSANGEPELSEFSRSLYESIQRYEVMAQAASESDARESRGTPDELLGISGQASPAELARARDEIRSDERAASFDIPVTINEAVISMVATFTSRDSVRQRFGSGLARAGRYMPMIRSVLQREGLPGDLAYVAMIESSFKTNAHSRARAHGVWQFIAATGRRYGLKSNRVIDERSDPLKATEAAARYLKDLYEIFDDWYLAMAAYDSGEGRVARAVARTGIDSYWKLCRTGALPRETRLYVPSVIAAALIAKNPTHYGFDVQPDPALAFETVLLRKPVSLRRLASACGLPFQELHDLNPELKSEVTPRLSGGYALRLPQGTRDTVEARLDSLPEAQTPSLGRSHKVRRGETLARVARKFGVSVAALADANDLAPQAALTLHTVLIIPDREPVSHRRSKKHKRPARRAARTVGIPAEGFVGPTAGARPPEQTAAASDHARAAPASP